jgi:hypothetical protein
MVFAFAGDSTMTRFFCSIKKENRGGRGAAENCGVSTAARQCTTCRRLSNTKSSIRR